MVDLINKDSWLDKIRSQYNVNCVEKHSNQQFNNYSVDVSDGSGNGMPFNIAFDEDGLASIINIPILGIDRLNIAEGFTSLDILNVADQILRGEYNISQTIFNNRRFVFKTSIGEVTGKLKFINKSRIFESYALNKNS